MTPQFSKSQFSTLLGTCIVPAVLQKAGITNVAEIDRFYRSNLYSLLENKATSIWHLSPKTLADMYKDELQHEPFLDPEEQS